MSARGFTKWLLDRDESRTPIGKLAKLIAQDENWLDRSTFFADFALCLQRAGASAEMFHALGLAWLEYHKQETPLLEYDYYNAKIKEFYAGNLPKITRGTETYPAAPLNYLYVFAVMSCFRSTYKMRYIDSTLSPVDTIRKYERKEWIIEKATFLPMNAELEGNYPYMVLLDTVSADITVKRVEGFVWFFTWLHDQHLHNKNRPEYIYPPR